MAMQKGFGNTKIEQERLNTNCKNSDVFLHIPVRTDGMFHVLCEQVSYNIIGEKRFSVRTKPESVKFKC